MTDEQQIRSFVDAYYYHFLKLGKERPNGEIDEANLSAWSSLFTEDVLIEDPAGTTFGTFRGRADFIAHARQVLQQCKFVDVQVHRVITQPTEHRASILWTIKVEFGENPKIPADRRGRVIAVDGISNWVLNDENRAIRHTLVVFDHRTTA